MLTIYAELCFLTFLTILNLKNCIEKRKLTGKNEYICWVGVVYLHTFSIIDTF